MSVTKKYLSLVKFSHTIFAMPFAMIGFFLGIRDWAPRGYYVEQPMMHKTAVYFQEHWMVFVLVVLCMVFARSAAMAFNRYLDRGFDAKNPRTAIREIPAGLLKANTVLIFTMVNAGLFILCTYFINKICFYLSPVALAVILGYSYTKRFTAFCHLVLGLGLSLAPIGAYLAVTGVFAWLPVLFSLAVIFWVSGFDVIYSLQDEAFDADNKLYSMPSRYGKPFALQVSTVLHLLSAACVVMAGKIGYFNWLYWVGVLVFGGMLVYQHSIVKPDDLRRVNIAFMTANGLASVVFAVLVISDLIFVHSL
ncbi:MAG: UbiA-like polyprenyltransferase [Niabella sp.]